MPPYLKEPDVKALVLKASQPEGLLVHKASYNVRSIRTATWQITATCTKHILGAIFRSAAGDEPLVVISAREYAQRKQSSSAKWKTSVGRETKPG